MEIRATLTAVSSKSDMYGNRYWALEYHELDSGKIIRAKISGADSNIYGILRHMYTPDDWDTSIMYMGVREMKIREFNKYVKGLPYAGCAPDELAQWIKNELSK